MRRRLASWLAGRLGAASAAEDAQRHARRLYEASANHEERLRRLEAFGAAATWIEHAELARAPLVSVVLPTRDRAAVLGGAIRSVLAQTYPGWELVVVDDGSADATREVVDGFSDQRVRYLRAEGRGPGAARNRGLDEARGELIAYLDDDNRMHPAWLKAVAWAFGERPDLEVLYGGWVIDDPARLYGSRGGAHGSGGGALPELWFTPWEPELQLEQAIADMSAIAHRAGIAGARFDEEIAGYHDWEFLARLTLEREPLALPVVACLYGTRAESRLSSGRRQDASREEVRARVRAMYVPRRMGKRSREDSNE